MGILNCKTEQYLPFLLLSTFPNNFEFSQHLPFLKALPRKSFQSLHLQMLSKILVDTFSFIWRKQFHIDQRYMINFDKFGWDSTYPCSNTKWTERFWEYNDRVFLDEVINPIFHVFSISIIHLVFLNTKNDLVLNYYFHEWLFKSNWSWE